MKKLSYVFFVLISLCVISCSSDDNSSNGDDLFIKFTANGTEYNFEPATLTSLSRLIMGDREINDVYTRISLWMPVTPVLGSHDITDDFPSDSNIDTLYNANFWLGDDTYEATSGTFTLTQVSSEYLSGTFSFTATNDEGTTIEITNGSFRAFR